MRIQLPDTEPILWIEAMQHGAGDVAELLHLLRAERVDHLMANELHASASCLYHLVSALCGEARVGRSRVLRAGGRLHQALLLQPGHTTCDSRERVALVRAASVDIRSVRSGASDNRTSTKYS